MKIRFLLILLLCCHSLLFAQSYEKRWERVESALQRDLPQTALSEIEGIRQKALSEQNDDELMRALLVARVAHADYAPDSARVALARLEQMLLSETDPLRKALWSSAIGQIYAFRLPTDTSAQRKGRELLMQSIADFHLLSAESAQKHLPLFLIGKQSKYYHHSLLPLLSKPALEALQSDFPDSARRLHHQLLCHYRSLRWEEATLLQVLDSIRFEHTYGKNATPQTTLEAYLETEKQFSHLDLNVETFLHMASLLVSEEASPELAQRQIASVERGLKKHRGNGRSAELKNFLQRKQQPSVAVENLPQQLYPAKNYQVSFRARNVEKVELRFSPLMLTARELAQKQRTMKPEELRQFRKGSPIAVKKRMEVASPYHWQADSIRLSLPRVGTYLLEVFANGKCVDQTTVLCSKVGVFTQQYPENQVRITLLDAQTGHPLAGKVQLYSADRQLQGEHEVQASADLLQRVPSGVWMYGYAVVENDAYSPRFPISSGHHPSANSGAQPKEQTLQLFTDRSLYRPGQKVYWGGFAYEQQADDVSTVSGQSILVRLHNAQGKIIDSLSIVTDELGSVGGIFQLPDVCLPGNFSIRSAHFPWKAVATFSVEEYRRPTFSVNLDGPSDFSLRTDSLLLKGEIKTFTAVPIEKAQVKWSMTHHHYWRSAVSQPLQAGETFSNADGFFYLPLRFPKGQTTGGFYRLRVEATAGNGETVNFEKTFYGGGEVFRLESNFPPTVCAEDALETRQTFLNPLRQNVEKTGEGEFWYISSSGDSSKVLTFSFSTARPLRFEHLRSLKSGHYRARFALSHADSLYQCSKSFVLFSETDTRPPCSADFFVHHRTSSTETSQRLSLGSTSDSILLFCDVFAGHRHIESRRMWISDTLLHHTLDYRSEFADGAQTIWTYMKNGRLHTTSIQVVRPAPKKDLQISWSSFRSCLTPGADEEWTLCVSHADGTPASASVMARLYDASLDALKRSNWGSISIPFRRNFFQTWSASNHEISLFLSGSLPFRHRKQAPWKLTAWHEELFANTFFAEAEKNHFLKGVAMRPTSEKGMFRAVKTMDAVVESSESSMLQKQSGVVAANGEGSAPTAPLRSNFSETAYFSPTLRTDSAGNVLLKFRLPESLTAWHFNALAHTDSMEHALLDTILVARKKVMIQMLLPRFLRESDSASIPVSITNLTDSLLPVKIAFDVRADEATSSMVRLDKCLEMLPQSTKQVFFTIQAPRSAALLVVRAAAEAVHFSDGEERFLPVLSNEISVNRTLPFTLVGDSSVALRVDTLWNRPDASRQQLTLELTGEPIWQIVGALPPLVKTDARSATDWSEAYYALTMARHIARCQPEIAKQAKELSAHLQGVSNFANENQQAELPWLAQAEAERTRYQLLQSYFDETESALRRHSALHQLRDLQLPDGSWAWFKGMAGNADITLNVLTLLARLKVFAADKDGDGMLQSAFKFLNAEVQQRVERMKASNDEQPSLDSWMLRYLYVRSLLRLENNEAEQFLLKCLTKSHPRPSMHEKALAVFVLAENGFEKEALAEMNALMEHTVCQPTSGRYYDAERALRTRTSYRIPTQTATIEAIQKLLEKGTKGAEKLATPLAEMKQWLLQAKRTQMWETSRATTDAIYALLSTEKEAHIDEGKLPEPKRLFFQLKQGRNVIDSSTAESEETAPSFGYVRRFYDAHTLDSLAASSARPVVLTVRETGLQPLWGSVMVDFMQPLQQVDAAESGLRLECAIDAWRGGRWQELRTNEALRVGERVRHRYIIYADADYDFIKLQAPRAACLEPAQPLSATSYEKSLCYYRAVHDADTHFYIDRLHKGQHVITEEFYVQRSGRFKRGVTTLHSTLASEYGALAPSVEITVEK